MPFYKHTWRKNVTLRTQLPWENFAQAGQGDKTDVGAIWSKIAGFGDALTASYSFFFFDLRHSRMFLPLIERNGGLNRTSQSTRAFLTLVTRHLPLEHFVAFGRHVPILSRPIRLRRSHATDHCQVNAIVLNY